jgi:hypothetical protein
MPRPLSLKPYRVPSRQKIGKASWCVDIPPELSGTGKRQQPFFRTEAEARSKAEEVKARRDNLGTNLASVTAPQLLEVNECQELLEDHPELSLRNIVREYLKIHKTRTASIPFRELFEKYLEARSHRSPEHLYQMKWCLKNLEELHHVLACDLSTRMLDEALVSFTPSVRDQFRRHIHAVLEWGWKRDYLISNPAAKLEVEEWIKAETEIFEPEIVEATLNDCLENDLELLPYRVFGFFCGIRPYGELPRLHWNALDWQAVRHQLKILAIVAKKKTPSLRRCFGQRLCLAL